MAVPRPANPMDALDKKTLEAMNFNVLRRIDPNTQQVLATAGHVALYDFDKLEKGWQRKGVEGTLFLIKRRIQPTYQYIILNKKSQDHYVEDILEGFKFEKSEPYLLYKNVRDEVIGVWFYDKEECNKVEALLQSIVASGSSPSPAPATAFVQEATQAEPLQEKGVGGEDAFWDKGVAGPAPQAALLNLNGQRPEVSSGGAAVAQGSPPPRSAGNTANHLENLFSKMRVIQPTPSGSDLANTPSKAPPPKSHGAFRVPLTPGNSADAPQTAGFSTPQGRSATPPAGGTPFSAFATPAADLSSDAGLGPSPSARQLPTHPALLTPAFFRQTSTPAAVPSQKGSQGEAASASPLTTPSLHSAPAQVPAGIPATRSEPSGQPSGSEAFMKLFAPKAASAQHLSAMPKSQPPAAVAAPAAESDKERVRTAVRALAESDVFIDVLVQELKRSGLTLQ